MSRTSVKNTPKRPRICPRSELNKYNQQVLKEARKRLAEKYGDTYDENESDKD